MRLNLDCVRDILLCVEENVDYRRGIEFFDSYSPDADIPELNGGIPKYNLPLFEKYGDKTTLYHVRYCLKDNLLEFDDRSIEPYIGISDLTPNGHAVLNDIRDQKVFERAKSVALSLSLASLPSIQQIISKMAKDIVNSYFSIGRTT